MGGWRPKSRRRSADSGRLAVSAAFPYGGGMWLLDKMLGRLIRHGELLILDTDRRENKFGTPAEGYPDVTQRLRDGHPLPLLFRERRAAVVGEHVVPATTALGRGPPLRGDVPEPAQAVQQRVEHPVGPLELTPRELAHPLEDRVPVALAVGEDREHQRRRRRRDQVLVDAHARPSHTLRSDA